MAGAEKVAEKVPGWVERLLIPTLETRIRAIVREEVALFEKTVNARFDGIDARFQAMNTKFDSLQERLNIADDIAEIKARLTVVENRISG